MSEPFPERDPETGLSATDRPDSEEMEQAEENGTVYGDPSATALSDEPFEAADPAGDS